MLGDPMVLLESESETVELKMSARMIRKLCILCKNKDALEVGIKKSFYIETTRLT